MCNRIIIFLTLIISTTVINFAQEPEEFFPFHVGDIWEYNSDVGYFYQRILVRDSVSEDKSHNLFYNDENTPHFRVDSSFNVFENPKNWNYLRYKLDTEIGEVWENPQSGELRWAWLSRIDTAYLYSHLTIIKVFRYGPVIPDSAGAWGLLEEWLATGFGLIYSETGNGYTYLQGCVIDDDTLGFVTSVEDIESERPAAYSLKQNYPNPFNPATVIEFELPHKANISITVYDILGREINILYKGESSAGIHKIKWDASGLASGIYFCRLQADKYNYSIKMILTK